MVEFNEKYIHHQKNTGSSVREVVFGAEDGMVSTLGTITGIAIGTGDHFVVVLAGIVIIAVESISMGVGSYLSSKSEKEVDEQKIREEREEIKKFPKEERDEMEEMYIADGWPKKLAKEMADTAGKNPELLLKEMAYRELKVFPDSTEAPLKNGLLMLISYIGGGIIPVMPYFFLPIQTALITSISITLCGLFGLGVATTRFTKRNWMKAGLEMLTLATLAAAVGYFVGASVDKLVQK